MPFSLSAAPSVWGMLSSRLFTLSFTLSEGFLCPLAPCWAAAPGGLCGCKPPSFTQSLGSCCCSLAVAALLRMLPGRRLPVAWPGSGALRRTFSEPAPLSLAAGAAPPAPAHAVFRHCCMMDCTACTQRSHRYLECPGGCRRREHPGSSSQTYGEAAAHRVMPPAASVPDILQRPQLLIHFLLRAVAVVCGLCCLLRYPRCSAGRIY